jgi:hypothetical protein
MPGVRELAALQQAEEQLAQGQARLKEIARALAEPAALLAKRMEVASAEAKVQELRRQLRLHEEEANLIRAKKRAGEEKLYSGTVTNPRELRNLQMEGETLSRRLAQLEDDILSLMLALDEANSALATAAQELAALEGENAERVAALQAQQAELGVQVQKLQAELGRLRGLLPPGLLQRYESLKARKGGRAVALVRGENCQACGVQLPTHVIQRLKQGGELVLCPACGRILCPP